MRDLPPTAVVVPRWIQVALGELGTVEDVRPGKSNKRVELYHSLTRAGVADDSVAWCSSFVGFCLEMAGVTSTKSKTAASYATWGEPCSGYYFGSVIVFGKSDPDAVGSGHVGFCMGASGDDVYCLGGNQSNRVSIAARKASGIVATRWPHSVELPAKARP